MDDPLIHEYSRNGDLDGLNELITQGTDVNESDDYGNTPLHEASIEGHLEVVKVLLASGGLVNQGNNGGDTPRYGARQRCH